MDMQSSSTMSMSGTDDSSTMSMNMDNYFYASASATILFQSWQTSTWAEMLGSCFAVALLAVVFEGLRVGRQVLAVKMNKPQSAPKHDVYSSTNVTVAADAFCPCDPSVDEQSKGSQSADSEDSIVKVDLDMQKHHERHPLIGWSHLIQTGLYFVQLWIGLLMMLIFMSFNVYLCLAITVGGAVGYYCFAWVIPAYGDGGKEPHVGNELAGVVCH